MPTPVQNQQVMRASNGFVVYRAAAALPSSTLGSLFTISGGRALIRALTGQVVTLLSGTNSTSVGITPSITTTSAPTALCSAGVIPVAVGAPLTAVFGSALSVIVNGALLTQPWYAPAGDITITTASTVTGTVKWELIYVPLDPATVVVAA